MSVRASRREFLKGAAVVGMGASLVGRRGLAQGKALKKPVSPNEKLNIGAIGVAGQGGADLNAVASENIVALCDVDSRHLDKVGQRFPKAAKYKDWRKLLEQKDLQAVVIGCPDHHHALACVAAMKLGMHVFCEKPLAHSVYESRKVRETYAAAKGKVATQMGTQIHAGDNYRRVVELIQSGAIGTVTEAHVWCNRRGPGGGLPQGEDPVPSYLDWDLWLGAAPFRPYNKAYLPGNLTWNRWWDFGNGTLGDMGSHLIDLPFWALKLRQPTTVEAHGKPEKASPYTNPNWLIATWEHPAPATGRP